MGLTDIVTDQPQELKSVRALAKLPPGFEVHGVDDEMTMDMVGIAVGGDQDFRTGPGPGGKFQSDLVGLFGRDDFRGREGLHILIEVDAVHLAVGCLGSLELQNGIQSAAVDAADEIPL